MATGGSGVAYQFRIDDELGCVFVKWGGVATLQDNEAFFQDLQYAPAFRPFRELQDAMSWLGLPPMLADPFVDLDKFRCCDGRPAARSHGAGARAGDVI